MILQEKIKKEADKLMQLATESLEGANFNPKLPWISVKDDFPCNHKELLDGNITCPVFGRDKNGKYYVTLMGKFDKWVFIFGDITHWMPITKPPKE